MELLQRTVGNRAVGQMVAAQLASRPAPLPPVQRTVVLKQLDGSETTVANVETLKTWLSRFGITLDRNPLRLLKLYVMHDAETSYTYPWHLAGGEDAQRFIDDLDGLTFFPGAEYTVPWLA
ncbi:MAG TPA: hypothetical protein VMW65_03730, partial [Chloroflexota bacterium]|nr:hypothetical protein [Chloroflexota bacterium]